MNRYRRRRIQCWSRLHRQCNYRRFQLRHELILNHLAAAMIPFRLELPNIHMRKKDVAEHQGDEKFKGILVEGQGVKSIRD